MRDSVVLPALEQGRAGVMLAHLLTTASAPPPPVVGRACADLLRRAAAAEALATTRLRSALALLDRSGVSALVMKGAALSYTCYPAPHLRPRYDDDVLVAKEDFARASAALESAGYVAEPQVTGAMVTGQRHFARADAHGLHHIDLHWRLVNPAAFAGLPAFADLRASSVPLPGLDGARGLGPEHALLLACVHRVAHHTPTEDPQWLLDIHLLASRLAGAQWDRFVALAVGARQAAVCAAELTRARAVFDTAVPDAALTTLGRVHGEPAAAHLRAHDPLRVQWLNFRHAGTWGARFTLAVQHLFPSADYVRRRYEVTHDVLLPWYYVRRAMTGLTRWIREAVARSA